MIQPAFSPAAERNKQPLLEALQVILPTQGMALEIASGTGQHATWFAAALPQWQWQPTDFHVEAFESIRYRTDQAGLVNVKPPLQLDVMQTTWLAQRCVFDLIFCANMIHISPWAACIALFKGSARHLAQAGKLVTYGPYFEAGVAASEGNISFDQSLRSQNSQWGIRDLDDVKNEAALAGLYLMERRAMPANNLLLVWATEPALLN